MDTVETRTERSGLTLAAIVDVALRMAAADGLESLTIGEVAKRLGLSKSGVFSRIGSREALQRAVLANLWLEARVRAALRADPATRDVDVTVMSDGGRVILSGMVVAADELPAAERVARSVVGVTSVDNALRVMARSRLFPQA